MTIVLPDNPVTAYSAANINLAGIGVYDSQNGNEFDFRGIASANSSLTVTLDAGNNAILLTLDVDVIVDDLPQATTAQRGVGETATDAEAIAKASITTFLTPSNLAALGSSSTFAGLVELATDAETQAGASATLAVTPAGLASVTATLQGTVTFADAVARNAATPDFDGQLGVQLNTDIAYLANAAGVGNWSPLLSLNSANNQISSNTDVDCVSGSYFTFLASDANGGGASFNSRCDFGTSSFFSLNSVLVGASRLLGTNGAGAIASHAIADFISTNDTQTGYTAFANGAVLRTCDTATVTLPQLAQIVGTLIEDLKAVQLPAT